MAPFTLPNSPLGRFVKANYKTPGLQRRVFQKLRKSGFTPPQAGRPGAPTARDRLLPPELIGVAGVRGPFFGITPRLNPNDYRFVTNDRGRIFAEPITELTGLTGQQRKDVTGYDAETARTVPHIQGTYGQLGTALNTEADAAKARLASLGSLIQGSAPVPGAVDAVPGADAQLAEARRREAGANAAVTVGQMSALPQIAATEGTRAVTGYQTGRQEGRTALLQGIRQQNAEAAAAELEARQAQQELAAQLRGQDLQLLGTQISQQGGLERALVSARTSRDNTLDRLETQLLIAELNGNVSEANSIRAAMSRIQVAGINATGRQRGNTGKAKADRAKALKEWRSGLRKALTGDMVSNPDYDRLTNPTAPKFIPKPGSRQGPADIFVEAVQQGLPVREVFQALQSARPNWLGVGSDRTGTARVLVNLLQQAGWDRRRATSMARQITGVNLGGDTRAIGLPPGQG